MTDVVLIQIISNIFWLILVVLIIGVFRRQLKALLDSLGSFDVAGAHFELRDKQETLESYAILSEILLQVLERRDNTANVIPMLSDKSTRRLGTFIARYAEEVPQDDQEQEVVMNVAVILGRRGRIPDAMRILDARLKKVPDDWDANNQKALWLYNTGVAGNIRAADKIYDRLVKLYPKENVAWYNRAQTKSHLGNYDQALSDLKRAIELGFRDSETLAQDPGLDLLKRAKPSEFKKIEDELDRARAKQTESYDG